MRPHQPLALPVALALLVAACSGTETASTTTGAAQTTATTTASTTTTGSTTTSAPTTAADATDATGQTPIGCQRGSFGSDGDVERIELVETSGLAASRSADGVLWAHNDSGHESGVFALDTAGRDLGFFALVDQAGAVVTTDVEDLAIVDDRLYLGDIGDNGRGRPSVTIHVVAEPEPGADGVAEVLESIEVRYPDGPTDAEALLVDPVDGTILILSKDSDDVTAPTRLYAVPRPAEPSSEPVTATLVGQLDVAALSASSSSISIGGLLFPGNVTAADVSPTGDLVVIRTYGSAWSFPREPGQSLVDALGNEPCETGAAGETQGEAIAFLPGTDPVRYVTIGEGEGRAVNVVTLAAIPG